MKIYKKLSVGGFKKNQGVNRFPQVVLNLFGFSQQTSIIGQREPQPRELKKTAKYTPEEVLRYLRGQESGERAEQVMQEAAVFYSYKIERIPSLLSGRDRLIEKLPNVLFQYNQGKSSEEIARTISYLSTPADVEDAMNYISQLIADRVNA